MRSHPRVCSIASLSCLGAQQPAGRAAWDGWTASANSTTSSSPKEFSLFVVRDELLLLVFIELAGDGIGLVIFQPEAMQQRDQSRAAFVNEAEFLRDEGTDFPRRARQRGSDKGFQGLFLHSTQKAAAAAVRTCSTISALNLPEASA